MKLEDNRQEKEEQCIYLFLKPIFISLAKPCEITYTNDSKAFGFFGGVNNKKPQVLLYNFSLENSKSVEPKKYIPVQSIKYFTVKNFEQKQKSFTKIRNDLKKNNLENDSNISSQKNSTTEYIQSPQNREQFTNQINGVQVGNQLSEFFMTDQQISEIKQIANHKNNKKQLQRWTIDDQIELETLENDNDNTQQFDQFEENQKLDHNMEDFNEEEYTTKIDYTQFTEEQIMQAKQQAQEIQDQQFEDFGNNRHILEERNLIELRDHDENEEVLYSQVQQEEIVIDKPSKSKFKKFQFLRKNHQAKPKTILNYIKNKWNNEHKNNKGQELLDSITSYRNKDKSNQSFLQDSFMNQSYIQQNQFEQSQLSALQNSQFFQQSTQPQQQILYQGNYQQQQISQSNYISWLPYMRGRPFKQHTHAFQFYKPSQSDYQLITFFVKLYFHFQVNNFFKINSI